MTISFFSVSASTVFAMFSFPLLGIHEICSPLLVSFSFLKTLFIAYFHTGTWIILLLKHFQWIHEMEQYSRMFKTITQLHEWYHKANVCGATTQVKKLNFTRPSQVPFHIPCHMSTFSFSHKVTTEFQSHYVLVLLYSFIT